MNLRLRAAARALLVAMVASLAADAALGTLTRLVDVTGASAGTPWWVAAHLVERGRWVVLAVLLVAVASRLPESPAVSGDDVAAWRGVGGAVVVAPLLWVASTWIVQAVLFTVAGRWDVDGQVFLASGYYQALVAGYAPWLLGGMAAIALGRHAR